MRSRLLSDDSAATILLSSVKLLAPIQPGKLVCVGLNQVLLRRASRPSIGVGRADVFMCSSQAIIKPDDVIADKCG